MSLSIEQKKAVVSEVSEVFNLAQAAVLAEYRGLSVEQITELRAQARENGVEVRVVKNTLARRSVAGTSFECLSQHFTGPVLISSSGDPVAVAKVVSDFAKSNDALKITVGVMNGNLIDQSTVQALAKLPSREELLATLVATMQTPLVKFVQTLNEVPGKLVRTLAAVRDSQESQAA